MHVKGIVNLNEIAAQVLNAVLQESNNFIHHSIDF